MRILGHLTLKSKLNPRNKGFSLVELMIVVAIVGALASIAIPNFNEFVKRARATEAKTNLAALYVVQHAFHAEYGSYTTVLDSLGFRVSGNINFNIGFDNNFLPPPGAPPGTPGCRQLCPIALCGGSYATWNCTSASANGLDGTYLSPVSASTFRAGAHSHYSPNPQDWYSYSIDQNKQFRQIIPAN